MTRAMVRRHTDAIARVAAALMRNGQLDFREIESLVPLRRWPQTRNRPNTSIQRDQQQELIRLLRAPQQRLSAAVWHSSLCGD
jgi:hypothetical protein